MFTSVQSLGSVPLSSDLWNIRVTAGARFAEHCLRTRFGRLSGPLALCCWIWRSSFSTPFESTLMLQRDSSTRSLTGGMQFDVVLVKTEQNCLTNISAICLGSLWICPSSRRGETHRLSVFLPLI